MASSPLDITLDFSGQLHNLPDLERRLGVRGASLSEVITQGWLRWGTALAEHLVGDYSFVLHDAGQRLHYLARDPIGVRPLFWRLDQGQLSHGFSIPQLRSRCPLPATPDPDWVACYLLGLSFSVTDSAFKEIRKLPPAHWMTVDAAGRTATGRHHHWRDDAPFTTRRDPRWVEAYRAVLEEAIRCRMPTEGPIGTENSGGLDSATITAYLAKFLGPQRERLHTFGYALFEQEPALILSTSQAWRLRHNHVFTEWAGGVSPDEQSAHSLKVLGYPEEHGNASGHRPFYEACQLHGIRTLYSGFGGDEVATNPGFIVRRELRDRGHYLALWDCTPGNAATRVLRYLKELASFGRRSTHNPAFLRAYQRRWAEQPLRPEVVLRLNLYERFMEQAVWDAPYRRLNDFILQQHLDRMEYVARLENCTVYAGSYGINYYWPLLDARLIQRYLSTPSVDKLGPRGVNRYLHRSAVNCVVPASISNKSTKSMGSPTLPVEDHLKQLTCVSSKRPRDSVRANSFHPLLEAMLVPGSVASDPKWFAGKVEDSNTENSRRRDRIKSVNAWLLQN